MAYLNRVRDNGLEEAARKVAERNRQHFEQGLGLSIKGHIKAEQFAVFIRPYLKGLVLDVGCGPQPKPLYLEGYDDALICGLDPLPPFTSHPFAFRTGIAERIPWGHQAFDVAITATSLGHTVEPDMAIWEIWRVLKPGGVWLCWEDFYSGAKKWEPEKFEEPLDEFHLYHFDYPWFLDMVGSWFSLAAKKVIGEYLPDGDGQAVFFKFIKEGESA